MKQLQTWLGHSDIQMTYNTYGHLLERDPAQEAAFMARVERYVLGDAPAD
ncbi:MAG: recombinase [Alphaproteobacteria bacterium]|nr:recombinase [Alphaproteobacteria bacterium]